MTAPQTSKIIISDTFNLSKIAKKKPLGESLLLTVTAMTKAKNASAEPASDGVYAPCIKPPHHQCEESNHLEGSGKSLNFAY